MNSFYLMMLQTGVDLITGFYAVRNSDHAMLYGVEMELSLYLKRTLLLATDQLFQIRVQFNHALDFSLSPPENRSSTSTVPVLMPC